MEALIGAAKGDLRALTMISLLYESGVRVGELCQAKRNDFVPGIPAMIKVVGKGNKTRIVPLGKQVASIVVAI